MKPASLITILFLFLVAALHLIRLIFNVEVVIAGLPMPWWTSLFGCLFTAGLGVMLWRETRTADPQGP
jgi:membrane protein implicated in regulation of membrane protease activity